MNSHFRLSWPEMVEWYRLWVIGLKFQHINYYLSGSKSYQLILFRSWTMVKIRVLFLLSHCSHETYSFHWEGLEEEPYISKCAWFTISKAHWLHMMWELLYCVITCSMEHGKNGHVINFTWSSTFFFLPTVKKGETEQTSVGKYVHWN